MGTNMGIKIGTLINCKWCNRGAKAISGNQIYCSKICCKKATSNKRSQRLIELKKDPQGYEEYRQKCRIYDIENYYKNHKERKQKGRDERTRYFLKNPERERARGRRYKKTTKGRLNYTKHWNKRRARMLKVYQDGSVDEQFLKSLPNYCEYCGSTDHLSLDHIEPLSLGGSHTDSDIVKACRACNSSKGNLPLLFWMVKKHLQVNSADTLILSKHSV